MSETRDPSPKEPPRRKRHWILRTLLVLLILIIVIALVVQIVLWTDIPRGLVIGQVEKNLGLRVNARSLSTGWLGHTVLHDVDLGLPLSDKTFLKVPTMKVHTNTLFGLMLGNGVAVKAIELDKPTLNIWQDENGRWNLQEVAALVAGALGKKPAEAKSSSTAPAVPNVRITDGTIVVTDIQKRTTTIAPLELSGYAETPISWAYDLRVQPDPSQPPRVGLKGRLAPGGIWQHQVDLGIQNIADWITPWNPNPPAFYLAMSWQGQFSNAGLAGQLNLHQFQLGENQAHGIVNIAQGGGEYRLNPSNLLIKPAQHIAPEIKVSSGSILYNGSEALLRQLVVNIYQGAVRLDGSYNPNAHTGQVDAHWEQLVVGKGVKSNGEMHARASHPLPNLVVFEGNVSSNGTAASGPWETRVNLGARGSTWQDFDWTIEAPLLQWHRSIPFKLDGLKFVGGLHPQDANGQKVSVLTLSSASLPINDILSGNGSYRLDKDQAWKLHLEGRNWKFQPLHDTLVSFVVDSHGDKIAANLDNLGIKGADTTLSLRGSYTYGIPKPVHADVTLTNAEDVNPAADVQQTAELLHGTLQGNASVEGTLAPALLEIKGTLKGREVDVFERHVGDIVMAINGDLDSDRLDLRTDHLQLFGGNWDLESSYQLDTDDIDLGVTIKDLSLRQLAGLADRRDVSGSLDGKLTVHVPALHFDPNFIHVDSTATLKDVRALDMALADEVTLNTTLDGGNLKINPLTIRHGHGQGEVHVAMNVNNPYRLDTSVSITQWPLDIAGAQLHADASVTVPDLQIDLPRKPSSKPKTLRIPGPSPTEANAQNVGEDPQKQAQFRAYANQVDIRANATLRGKPLGDLQLYAAAWERVLDVRAIHARLLNGRADGQARLDFADFTKSTGELTWSNLDPTLLTVFYPSTKDFSGLATGNARLAPAEIEHPLEPLAVVIKNQFNNGHWRTVPVLDAVIVAYVGKNPEDPQGAYRVVLGSGDDQTSVIRMDNGLVRIWGRVGRHANSTLAAQANISLEGLSLDPLVKAYDKSAKPMPGRLGGAITALFATQPGSAETDVLAFPAQAPATQPTTTAPSTQPSDASEKFLRRLYADGDVKLTQANLVGYGPIADLYNLMHLGPGLDRPIGTGNVRFHLEQGMFRVQQFRYFNRGVEARGVATVRQIWNLPDNPIDGTLIGTAQPLRQKKLPLLADINDILAALQRNFTTIAISGTVRNPSRRVILFGDVGDEMRRFIIGDVSSELGSEGNVGQ